MYDRSSQRSRDAEEEKSKNTEYDDKILCIDMLYKGSDFW